MLLKFHFPHKPDAHRTFIEKNPPCGFKTLRAIIGSEDFKREKKLKLMSTTSKRGSVSVHFYS